MAPRNTTLQIGRPFLVRPFTSVRAPAQDTKTPDFEFVIPRQDDEFILLNEAKWPTTRFVYLFLSKDLLADEDTWEGAVQRALLLANSAGNPLFAVIRVEPSGKQALCTGRRYQSALEANDTVTFDPIGKAEMASLEPQNVAAELEGSYAVASPVLIPLEAVSKLSDARPTGVPVLGTGMGIGITSPVTTTPNNPDWVFPVVDPILIAENLTRKFYEACDNFLAASQTFDRPAARSQADTDARKRGQVLRLQKIVADNLIALRKAAPSLESVFEDNLPSSFPDEFLQKYNQELEDLVFERERAAFELIAWIETEAFAIADDFFPRNGEKPDPSYDQYLKPTMEALARMAESDRGIAYLSDLRNRNETGSSPLPPGVLHIIAEYVFRSQRTSDEQLTLALKNSTTTFGVWSAFVAAAVSVKQRVVKGPNPTTNLAEDLLSFAKRLELVFRQRVLKLDLDNIPVELPKSGGTTKAVINVLTRSFVIGEGTTAFLQTAKLPTEHVARVVAVLNFGIAYAALRKALDENGDERAKNMAMSDLAGAGLGVVDQTLALPVVSAFRDKMAGKINTDGVLLGNRVASTLGLLGAIASLTSASLATAEEFDRGDWDEALAHMTEGFGAILVGTGSAIILVSGATGPFALWTIGVGSVISAAGFIWSVFAADNELDQMLKFCAFGQQSGEAATKPPGWTQCKATFAEWNRETVDGLLRQLKAFQQIFYSFEAAGAFPVAPGPLASDGILRITPASLRVACTFELEYTAVYIVPDPNTITTERTLKGKAVIITPSTVNGVPVFSDLSGNYEIAGSVRVHKDEGRDAIDVRFRLNAPTASKFGSPIELKSLTCLIQLSVPGAGADLQQNDANVLVVPTTAKGPRRVKVEPVKDRSTQTATVRSLAD